MKGFKDKVAVITGAAAGSHIIWRSVTHSKA